MSSLSKEAKYASFEKSVGFFATQEKRIISLLKDKGGMTARQVSRELDMELVSCRRALSEMAKAGEVDVTETIYDADTNRTVGVYAIKSK